MPYVVSALAETTIELTPDEANHLAYTAASQAHALDDFRYNGLSEANIADMLAGRDGKPGGNVAAWRAKKPKREAQQKRWRDIATVLNSERYPEGWSTHG